MSQRRRDIEAIKGATEELVGYMQQLGGQMYQDAEGETPPPGADEATYDDDEDVVDAEFTES